MSEDSTKKPVTVYEKDGCIQCVMTKKEMDKLGIKYNAINLSNDEDEKKKVKDMGYMAAPVVFVDEDDHWFGFNPDKIKALAS